MTQFEYISVLVSIVVAFALSELFTGWGRFLRRSRWMTFSWLHALWSGFLLLQTLQFWHGFWEFRLVEEWDFTGLVIVVVNGLLLVVLAQLSLPEVSDQERLDLRDFYLRQSPRIFTAMALLLVTMVLSDVVVADQPLWHVENAVRAAGIGICVALTRSRDERVHAGLFALGFALFLVFLFCRWRIE